ncbi:protein of unknown function (plasmid) [Azospirillum lipoferum 4B]|uniref:Uncharacterized protein n=1 Tax=Azospirillum lipoferum (strain 4B) TaxID=862719 RepID=G7ZIF8_AZOL4|nr:protein of unknown function [Azospirillum lipoferum 4B]
MPPPAQSSLSPAHAQTKFALTRQADPWSAESGERVGVRGIRFEDLFGCAEPPHPNLLPRGEKGPCRRDTPP